MVDRDAQGPWGEALAQRTPVQAPAGALSEVLAAAADEAGIAAVWAIAVPGGDPAEPDGLLVTWRLRPGPLLATHLRHVQEASRLSQLAFDWARSHSDLVVAATTDSLTGVANRAQLRTSVDADHSAVAALLFCDLDRFKVLNDRHGHAVGDLVLRAVADRLQGAVRSRDLLVRLGGDEFAVWCPELRSADDATYVAERMLASLAPPIRIAGRVHRVTCSIGIAVATSAPDAPDAHPDLEVLLRRADQALYQAKAAGGSRLEQALS
ncbi:GGDEF domain-containing protein [Aquihabitans sp. G128]|nr:GGDEF domain-containing protein [Aquihabitans sp. G128]